MSPNENSLPPGTGAFFVVGEQQVALADTGLGGLRYEFVGTGSDQADINFIQSRTSGEMKIFTYESIPINVGSILVQKLDPSVEDPILQVDINGDGNFDFTKEPDISFIVTSIDEITGVRTAPDRLLLEQNYPNPFNPSTTIIYHVPTSSKVKLQIYNLAGQQVATLVNEKRQAGIYSIKWDGTDESGRTVSSGLYLYKLESADFIQVRKFVIVR